ncbi:hypothetical protein CM240_0622 [Clostridium bornimense]|uniref:Phage protein n=1 Tax=Clostridium bornimense TaxID=1216932 RepID=W6S0H1_9CLOT|nr:hypothetical protein [Clostridium bornimense]CDM67787.1 hypothetical protein CM240_0622 [Clostridium bornimense]
MSVLSDINATLEPLGIPLETGVFKDEAPDKYIVVVPMADSFELHADNTPEYDVQEARISMYAKGSYTKDKNAIVRALLGADFTITDRRYIGYETETGYFHYNVDVAKHYEMEE